MDNRNLVELNESSEKQRFFIALLPPDEVQVKATELKEIMRDE